MQLVKAISSFLDKRTNTLMLRVRAASVGDDDADAPDFGDVPFAMALGLTSKPRVSEEGEDDPQIVVDDEVPGLDGIAVGGRDASTAEVTAALGSGETCLHSTGKGFLSRVFCKDRMVAIVCGNGTGIKVDSKNKLIQLFGFGMMIEMNGKEKEIRIDSQGTGIQIGGGVVRVYGGDLTFGAGNPPFHVMLGPPTGSPGGAASTPMVAAFGIKAGQ